MNAQRVGDDPLRKLIIGRIDQCSIRPNEKLGQHFLVDSALIDFLAQSVEQGNTVIEIGPGCGQLTEALAQRAGRIVAIEIDRRYEPILDQVTHHHSNVEVVYGDALAFGFQGLVSKQRKEGVGVQIIASLPYHITEPFLHQVAGLPVESVVLVVGKKLSFAVQAMSEQEPFFGQLTLLAQTFFNIDILAYIGKQSFYPVPRTDSVIMRLIPKEEAEFRSNRRDFVLRKLFITAPKSPLVKNALKEALIEFTQATRMGTMTKREYHQHSRRVVKVDLRRLAEDYSRLGLDQSNSSDEPEEESVFLTQNQARAIIEKMGFPVSVLNKPFQQLNNSELGMLSKALRV